MADKGFELEVEGSDARVGQGREGVGDGARGGTLRADSSLPALLRSPVGPLLIAAGPTIIYTILCLVLFFILRRRIPRIYSPKSINPLYSSKSYLLRWYRPHLASYPSNTRDGFKLATSQFLNHTEFGEPRSSLCSCRHILGVHWQVPDHIESDRTDWIPAFVLYILWRENLYYINLRHSYLSQSGYYERKTSRTILITSFPEHYLDEKVFQKLFGHSFVQCWIPRASRRLRKLVKKREKRAQQLQDEEIALINQGNRGRPSRIQSILHNFNRVKRTRSKESDVEKGKSAQMTAPTTKDAISQSDASKSSSNERSTSNLAAVRKINSARSDLHVLNQQIDKLRQEYQADQGKHINTAFIEFDSFANAQAAFQSIPQHQPLQMCRQVMGVKPGEIVWSCLRMKWWERLLREFLVGILIGGGVILWIMPIAMVDMFTSAQMVGKMFGVSELPELAVNALSGLGRALLMWILLEFIPFLMRVCAKFAGVPTLTAIEHFVHKRYFIFQTLQIFLGPMLRPSPIMFFRNITSLKQQMPEASILYMSYILVRCLSAGATDLIQLWQLFLNMTRSRRPGTPRTTYERLYELNVVHWGSVYPVMTTVGVIGNYACIAPLVLGFALTGLRFVYFVYKYTLVHIYDTETLDTTGQFYPRAIMHILLGLYLAQAYLILSSFRYRAWGQFSLLVSLAAFTLFIHLSLRKAMNPRIDSFSTLDHDVGSKALQPGEDTVARCAEQYESCSNVTTVTEALGDPLSTFNKSSCNSEKKAKHRMCGSWFRTATSEDFKDDVSPDHTEDEFMVLYGPSCYQPLETWLPEPKLWLPEDSAIGSYLEAPDTKEPLSISHDGTQIDKKGRVEFDLELVPFRDDLLFYRYLHLVF
ncbi:hypothetical protein F52700_4126 [Fusarium sp. NRRL 52700]|nr:hypothetical protein F52700_4126 [Fusarium sp. NRRL 52700]